MGRERELAEIRLAIQDASSGRGRMLLLSGEPGIGKTCLADQAASYAASRGMRVAWGRCWEGGGAPPFWPWVQILRELIGTRRDPGMPPIPEPVRRLIPEPQAQGTNHPEELHYANHARFRLFDSIATFLKQSAGDRPMMIVLDDLHESDQASLLMLRFLSRELGRAPILLTGTYREAEIAASQIRPSAAHFGSILSVENRAGAPSHHRLPKDASAKNRLFAEICLSLSA